MIEEKIRKFFDELQPETFMARDKFAARETKALLADHAARLMREEPAQWQNPVLTRPSVGDEVLIKDTMGRRYVAVWYDGIDRRTKIVAWCSIPQ